MRLYYSLMLVIPILLGVFMALGGSGQSNAVAQETPVPAPVLAAPVETGVQKIVLAGGCFWGVEAVFEHTRGVISAVSGYAGGAEKDASYKRITTGQTGHAESVEITYDPAIVTLGQILQIYFTVAHDPTQLNRQGPDVGTHYRSEIFTTTEEQASFARGYIAELEASAAFAAPVVTKVGLLEKFYPAEEYHQDFAAKNPGNPYIVIHDRPKVAALKAAFPDLYED
jgi:peptide-methionine (S)-S-oxide reductase